VDAVSLRGSRQAVVIARLDRAIHRPFAKFLRFMEEGSAPPTQAIIPCRCPVEETALPERRSTRSFGEYAFLEDSRYASQMKNISG
jgi:hypothetical protein